jgi:hypothetical protein
MARHKIEPPSEGGTPPEQAPKAGEPGVPEQLRPEPGGGPNVQAAEEGNLPADTTSPGIGPGQVNSPQDSANPGQDPNVRRAGQEQAPMMTSQGPAAGRVTTDVRPDRMPPPEGPGQTTTEEQDKGRAAQGTAPPLPPVGGAPSKASLQHAGQASEMLQGRQDLSPTVSYQERSTGRAPEALQAALKAAGNKTSPQLAPATERSSAIPSEQPQDGGEEDPSSKPPAENAPLTKQEQDDPEVQSLDALPDEELRRLADGRGVQVDKRHSRETVIRKLRQAGIRGPEIPEDLKEAAKTGQDQP